MQDHKPQKAEHSVPQLSFSVTLHLTHLIKLLSNAESYPYAHFFRTLLFKFCKLSHWSATTFPSSFFFIFGSVYVHMHPSQLFSPSLTRICTPIQTALHLSHLLPSSLLGEVWSVLANAGHRDLRPHPGHSAWHSGTGYLLCQDLCSLQGKMTCAAAF